MNATLSTGITLAPADWLLLFGQFALLSVMSVSGAIATVPDMQRFLVVQQGWLSPTAFSSSVAIAQAAPGPNVLFVAVMGWHVGLNAAGGSLAAGWHAWLSAGAGMALTLSGILLPSTVLTWTATRWLHRNRARRSVQAFRLGLTPVVVGLLLATGWVLARTAAGPHITVAQVVLVLLSAALVLSTRLHLLWLIAAGALAGALGWV